MLKTYNVYRSGGTKVATIKATCISKASKQFIDTLDKKAKYKTEDAYMSEIRYTDNYTIMSDFIVMQA